jgi:hypothetical protein
MHPDVESRVEERSNFCWSARWGSQYHSQLHAEGVESTSTHVPLTLARVY